MIWPPGRVEEPLIIAPPTTLPSLTLLKTEALQNAFLTSANFSIIATDGKGIIQLFNAVKYNQPGGSVAVECSLPAPGAIRISVRNTGPGLTSEQLEQLFQPLNRFGPESGAEEGIGSGVVVTKHLVELMGGTIGADSTLGVGSVFWIELARTSAPKLAGYDAERVALAQSQAREGTPLRTLLYVEDNPANLELVEQIIAQSSPAPAARTDPTR